MFQPARPASSASPTPDDDDGAAETAGPSNYQLKSIADPNGNALTFFYNMSGKLSSVTDSLGRSYTFTWNTATNTKVVKISDANVSPSPTREWNFGYDPATSNKLVSWRTPTASSTTGHNDRDESETQFQYIATGETDALNVGKMKAIAHPSEVAKQALGGPLTAYHRILSSASADDPRDGASASPRRQQLRHQLRQPAHPLHVWHGQHPRRRSQRQRRRLHFQQSRPHHPSH